MNFFVSAAVLFFFLAAAKVFFHFFNKSFQSSIKSPDWSKIFLHFDNNPEIHDDAILMISYKK
jgi:hypothetical protein